MLNKAVILVVEDHPLIMLGTLELVSNAGYEAIAAENADIAIGILEARPDISLVLTDVEMPGSMDGLKLAHYVRNRWPPIHLMIVSGRAALDATSLPSNTKFFPKPYTDTKIIEELTRLLAVPVPLASEIKVL